VTHERPPRNVILFPTCLVDLMFPDAARAAERVLGRAGCKVGFRAQAVCCGQPAWNSGHVEAARRVARGTLEALRGPEPIVTCSGSCTTMIQHYWPELFEDTPLESAARDVAARVREFSSFVAGLISSLPELRSTGVVTYHDSCHMLRGLGIKDAPRDLLGAIDGLELREMEGSERCCGFGGTFSIRYPELSCAMADEKVNDAASTGAPTVVASDIGCLMHICGRAKARGIALEGRYIAEILQESIEEGVP
jgi:L-lactate dehydrogenase complex protein LldE